MSEVTEEEYARFNAERRQWLLSVDRKDAEAEALRMWPEKIQLGRWDGIMVTTEQSLASQRLAFEMGAHWQSSRPSAEVADTSALDAAILTAKAEVLQEGVWLDGVEQLDDLSIGSIITSNYGGVWTRQIAGWMTPGRVVAHSASDVWETAKGAPSNRRFRLVYYKPGMLGRAAQEVIAAMRDKKVEDPASAEIAGGTIDSPRWTTAPGHYDGDGCMFPMPGHMIKVRPTEQRD